jgi:transposase
MWGTLQGLPGSLWALHDNLQSLQSLEPSGDLDRYLLCVDRIGLRRFDLHQSPQPGSGRKRGAFNNAIGRSRGGQTTKIRALTDDISRPHALLNTAGNVHDLVGVGSLLAMGHRPKRVLADRAYDANSLRQELAQRRIKRLSRQIRHPHRYSKSAYKGRNVIERMFCRLKDFRPIATRYDKRADIYLSTILLAAALTWWINCVRTLVDLNRIEPEGHLIIDC